MIKNASIRRILVASIALFITLIALYIFPKKEVSIPSKTIYKKAKTAAIYLIDPHDYVARTYINITEDTKEKIAFELVEALINGTNKNKYLPNGFTSYIASDTLVNSVKIESDIVVVDFNRNIFENDINNNEKILESIVYTLTEIDGINGVRILVNGQLLNKLPGTLNTLPEVLTRKIGINKKVIINSYKGTDSITTYFIGNYDNNTYFIPVTSVINSNDEKITVIIKELQGRDFIDDNLSTYLSIGVELKNYEIKENEVNLEFNNAIFNGFNEIDEETMYGIALSIKDNYDISNVNFNVDGKKIKAYALKSS